MSENKKVSNILNEQQGKILIKLARQTIGSRLSFDQVYEQLSKSLEDKVFQCCCGSFVSLHKHGSLRGCIGCLTSDEPLVEGIKQNALNAAFCDPRFPPLTLKELDEIQIEVSVLTEPEPLNYDRPEELPSRLRPHVDGVILSKGPAQSTFLPQVWKQLPQPEEFLSQLCMKAGLISDEWRKTKLNVFTYQVQCFEEESFS